MFIKRLYLKNKACLLGLLGIFLLSTTGEAQNNTPFSYYGIGEPHSQSYAQSRAMGEIAYGLRDTQNLNIKNPASYDALGWTTLEFGFQTKSSWFLNQEGQQKQSFNGSISYLAFGFPITENWGASAGLVPLTNTDYAVTNHSIFQQDTVIHRFRGEGKLYRFYIGNSYDLLGFRSSTNQSLSLGINASYVFGSFDKIEETEYPNHPTMTNVRRQDHISVSDLLFDIGLQHEIPLNQTLTLTSGLRTTLPSNLYATKELQWMRYVPSSNTASGEKIISQGVSNIDTGSIQHPAQFGFGATLHEQGKWMVGMDVSYAQWSNHQLLEDTSSQFRDNLRISAGAQFQSSPSGQTNDYWNFIKYRLGAYYQTGRLKIQQSPVPQMGLTFGVGLPVQNLLSTINLTFEVGQQGTITNNDFSETYFKTTVGFTLNDKWFVPSKIH